MDAGQTKNKNVATVCAKHKLYLHIFKNILFSQTNIFSQEKTVKFYGRNSFLIEGTVLSDSLKESPYDRLPFSSKGIVRDEVWDLSKASAGISVRFITDSSSVQLKWTVLNDLTMNHLA